MIFDENTHRNRKSNVPLAAFTFVKASISVKKIPKNKIKVIFDEIKNVSNFINENKPTGVEMYQELHDLIANVLE